MTTIPRPAVGASNPGQVAAGQADATTRKPSADQRRAAPLRQPQQTAETILDLEAWFAHDVEKPCELLVFEKPCPNSAEWVAVMVRDCSCPNGAQLLCDRCKSIAEQGLTTCLVHKSVICRITWVERSRGAA